MYQHRLIRGTSRRQKGEYKMKKRKTCPKCGSTRWHYGPAGAKCDKCLFIWKPGKHPIKFITKW